MEKTGRTLNWDDEISRESAEFILLPEGTYDFTVTGFERKWFNGSDKLPPCNQAEIKITIRTADGEATVSNNFYLHTSCEGIISSFFLAIGLKKHGEPTKMRWGEVLQKTGRCKIGIREYEYKGETKRVNQVKAWLEPAAKTYTKGAF